MRQSSGEVKTGIPGTLRVKHDHAGIRNFQTSSPLGGTAPDGTSDEKS